MSCSIGSFTACFTVNFAACLTVSFAAYLTVNFMICFTVGITGLRSLTSKLPQAEKANIKRIKLVESLNY